VQLAHRLAEAGLALNSAPQPPAVQPHHISAVAITPHHERVAEARATHDVDSPGRHPATKVVQV
jgi:hypothetical protein